MLDYKNLYLVKKEISRLGFEVEEAVKNKDFSTIKQTLEKAKLLYQNIQIYPFWYQKLGKIIKYINKRTR